MIHFTSIRRYQVCFYFIAVLFFCATAQAQIGYQVALLNSATGEPRAAEIVNVTLTITNAQNEQLYTATQRATTNDFGVLSLTVGNADTFKEADWNKLPFYIAATVDGTLIGKSQILNVPVAEYAKTAGPVLTKEMLVGTWKNSATSTYWDGSLIKEGAQYTFNSDGSYSYHRYDGASKYAHNGTYEIQGNKVYLLSNMIGGDYIAASPNLQVYCLEYLPTHQILIDTTIDWPRQAYIRQ